MKILYVCTANICRSPSAMVLMRDFTRALRVPDVVTASAGVVVVPGSPGCEWAPALRGRASQHRSLALVKPAVMWADLVLTATRSQQGDVLDLDPSVRARTFTIRQAGRIAGWLLEVGMPQAGLLRARAAHWNGQYPPDDPRSQVSPLTADWTAWLLEEIDAARGFAPLPMGEPSPDDIEDPHVFGQAMHDIAYRQLWDATNVLASLMHVVSSAPVGLPR